MPRTGSSRDPSYSSGMTKVVSALLLAGGAICFVLAAILAMTVGSLDVSILDVYFVVFPKYLLIAGALLILVSRMIWKRVAARK